MNGFELSLLCDMEMVNAALGILERFFVEKGEFSFILLCKALIGPLEDCLKFQPLPFMRDQFQSRIDEENVTRIKREREAHPLGQL